MITVPRKFAHMPWQQIINSSGHWFSVSTVRWWQCRVNWSTLTPIAADNFLFITSERSFTGERVYSVREWNQLGEVETPAGLLPSRKAALHAMQLLLDEEEAASGIEQAKIGDWFDR